MKIRTAEFVTSLSVGDIIPETNMKQVAFIGRSNVGKSSLINLLVGKKELARSSTTPGHTKTINLYLINKDVYFIDLPGYGFAQGSFQARENLYKLIQQYLSDSTNERQTIVLIIDAKVGVTELDKEMLEALEDLDKNILVVANKVDKIKKANYKKQLEDIADAVHPHKVIPLSTVEKTGVGELTNTIFS